MQSAKVILKNEVGLHARPAALLTQAASRFKSAISIERAGRSSNAKSIIGILGLGASKGDELTLMVSGEDEDEALTNLVALIEGFRE